MISKVEWQKRIEEYNLTGLSTRAWCKIQSIPDSIFRYHLSTLKRSESEKMYRMKAYLARDKAKLEKYHTRVRS